LAIGVDQYIEVWGVQQRSFRERLAAWFYAESGRIPSAESVNVALNVLTGRALLQVLVEEVWTRVGEEDGRIYLDLGNDEWEVVEISADGWEVTPGGIVRFRRPHGMLPLPKPAKGGDIRGLRRYLNFATEQDFMLMVGWLLGAFRPRGPFPVLALHGEQGTAKSTTSRVLRSLIDPNVAPVRGETREGRDLIIAASNSWVVAFDNLSWISTGLSDSLSRLATGGGFSKRQNYTDTDEILIEVQRPVLLNGIDEVVTRGDLLDRAIVITLPRIEQDARETERDFWTDFRHDAPFLLGALLDAVVRALKNSNLRLAELPRMADFVTWVAAAAVRVPARGGNSISPAA
jgi:hypothetical protein